MTSNWNMIILILCLIWSHPAHSFIVETVDDEETIPFKVNMLPMLTNFSLINSISINFSWHPSPAIEGIDLDQVDGIYTTGLYGGSYMSTSSSITFKNMIMLNETRQQLLVSLLPDTVYFVCFQCNWYKNDASFDMFTHNGPYRRECQLMRTYMTDEKTINPIPVFGEYTWEQKISNASTLAIVVNASISPELPHYSRSITVQLGSEIQTQEFLRPSEFAQFEFGGLELIAKDYPLTINYSLIESNFQHLFTVTKTVNGTVSTTIPSTPKPSMANKQFAFHSLVFIFSIVFLFFVQSF